VPCLYHPHRRFLKTQNNKWLHETDFDGIVEGSPVDNGTPVDDPEYNVDGVSIRQITVRNSHREGISCFTSSWATTQLR